MLNRIKLYPGFGIWLFLYRYVTLKSATSFLSVDLAADSVTAVIELRCKFFRQGPVARCYWTVG
jgi:hypothetical protein